MNTKLNLNIRYLYTSNILVHTRNIAFKALQLASFDLNPKEKPGLLDI